MRITTEQKGLNSKNGVLGLEFARDSCLPKAADSREQHEFENDEFYNVNYDCNQHVTNDEEPLKVGSSSIVSGLGNKQELLKISKRIEKDDHHVKSLTFDSKALNDLLGIGPAERKELVDNAKLVAFSLKTAVQDVDSQISLISESEAERSHGTLAIDTATYSKDCGNYTEWKLREDFFIINSYAIEGEKESLEKKGPKISKPHEKIQEEKLGEVTKGIRGRRKHLYPSPLRKSRNGVQSTPSSPKISQTSIESKKHILTAAKSLPNVPKSIPKYCAPPVLQREGTFTKEEGSILKKTAVKNLRAIPVLTRNHETQGSAQSLTQVARLDVGNKSAPTLRNSKFVFEDSRVTRPLSTCVTKNERRIVLDTNQKKHTSIVATSKTQCFAAAKRHSTSGSITQGMKNSSSNQSLKSNSSTKSASSVKLRNSAVQNAKSMSSASINSVSSIDRGKPKTPKKEVTSKIASLWKKVEETKQKNKNIEDIRVWIGPEKEGKISDEVLVLETEEILDIPTGKIVKSSTFQGLADRVPETLLETKSEVKNEILYSHSKWPEEKNSKSEGRSVISAIVAPYNYNPPSSMALTSYKQVDTFKKGSDLPLKRSVLDKVAKRLAGDSTDSSSPRPTSLTSTAANICTVKNSNIHFFLSNTYR